MASKSSRGIRSNVRYNAMTSNVGGVIQNRAERFMDATMATKIENLHATEDGLWSAQNIGYTNKNSTAYESGSAVRNLFWFTKLDGTDQLLMAINGKLNQIDTGTFASTTVDASAGYGANIVDGEQYEGKLYTCDGSIATPRTWDGTTAGASGGFPIHGTYSKPRYVEEHNGRLVYANFDGFPSHVVLSDDGAGETFSHPANDAADSAAIEVGPGDGQSITGIRSVFVPQSNDSFLIVTKQRSTYVITGRSAVITDTDGFTVTKINSDYGAVNNFGLVNVGNDVFAISELPGGGFGIISYTTAMQSGTIQPTVVNSDAIKDTLAEINTTQTAIIYGVHIPNRREVVFGVPTGADTTVKTWLVYKYSTNNQTQPRWSIRTGLNHSQVLLFKNKVYAGTPTGFLSDWFVSSTYNGTAINYTYEYPYNALGNEGQIKRIPTAYAHFKSAGNQVINIHSYWLGGGNNSSRSVALNLNTGISGSSSYGTAVYGTAVYGNKTEKKIPFKVFGNGERLKFNLQGSTTAAGGPEFLGITMFVEYGSPSGHWN